MYRALQFGKECNIITTIEKRNNLCKPPEDRKSESIILDLRKWTKYKTHPELFKKYFFIVNERLYST